MAKFKVEVDKDKCIGCGACVGICPENFALGDDGKAGVKNAELDDIGKNQEAADSCPVSAIKVTKLE